MSIKKYLKEHLGFLLIHSMIFFIIVVLLQLSMNGQVGMILLIGALWYGPLLSYITLEMIKYKRY
ncbi:MAG: hypothetical protein ACRCW2_06740 [Cellulosilyticaceae bacterium]